MPNRILREGLRSSGPINALSDRGHRLYTHLLVSADDFGLAEWTPSWVKATAIPLLTWTLTDTATVMQELSDGKLVRLYDSADKAYAAIEKWEQRRNAKHPKFPVPPWGLEHIIGGYVPPRAREDAPSAPKISAPVRRMNGNPRSGWWSSNDEILAKAKELGIGTAGESTDGLKRLCFAEIERRKQRATATG